METEPSADPASELDLRLDRLIDRDQEQLACPYPLFADLRDGSPVHWSEHLGAWVLTRYDDVLAVLHDTARFSSLMPTGPERRGRVMGRALAELSVDPAMAPYLAYAQSQGMAAVLLNADPPDHVRQRKLVNAAFRPRRLAALEPFITDVARRLAADLAAALAAVRPAGGGAGVDVVSSFAVALPLTVIAERAGCSRWPKMDDFKRWSDDFVRIHGQPQPGQGGPLGAYRHDAVRASSTTTSTPRSLTGGPTPADDLTTEIVQASIDGELRPKPLPDAEMLPEAFTQILVAGNETTTKLHRQLGAC